MKKQKAYAASMFGIDVPPPRPKKPHTMQYGSYANMVITNLPTFQDKGLINLLHKVLASGID
jgi:hypothetical protein